MAPPWDNLPFRDSAKVTEDRKVLTVPNAFGHSTYPWQGPLFHLHHCISHGPLVFSPQPIIGKSGVPQGPSEQKVAVVTVDDCDTSVALKFGAVLGNYSCSAQGTQSGTKK